MPATPPPWQSALSWRHGGRTRRALLTSACRRVEHDLGAPPRPVPATALRLARAGGSQEAHTGTAQRRGRKVWGVSAARRRAGGARRPARSTTVSGPLSARRRRRAAGSSRLGALRRPPRIPAQISPVRTPLTSRRGCAAWGTGLNKRPAHSLACKRCAHWRCDHCGAEHRRAALLPCGDPPLLRAVNLQRQPGRQKAALRARPSSRSTAAPLNRTEVSNKYHSSGCCRQPCAAAHGSKPDQYDPVESCWRSF